MIAPSRRFELRHPWWTVVFLTTRSVLFVLLALLPVWGWVQVRFSPVQRFYLPVYLQSTFGVLAGSGPEYVKWIEKRAPGKAWEIAQPEDLVPLKGGVAPFELSRSALSQGWSELGYTSGGTFQEQETRDYLEMNVFGGRSLLFLVLQPFELVLVGWMCWKFFDSWRNNLARERGLHWDPHYVPHTLDQDFELFAKQMIQEVKAAAVQVRRWLAPKQPTLAMRAVLASGSETVSPSGTVGAVASIPKEPEPKAVAPSVAKVAEVAPDQRPKPIAPVAKPSQPPASKSVPSSPFGKPVAQDEPERKWDLSQWIE
jgi:hypothetical protein